MQPLGPWVCASSRARPAKRRHLLGGESRDETGGAPTGEYTSAIGSPDSQSLPLTGSGVSESPDASASMPWLAYNYSPPTRTLTPVSVRTHGNVTGSNAGALAGQPMRLNGTGSGLTFDFGQEVGGIVSLNFARRATRRKRSAWLSVNRRCTSAVEQSIHGRPEFERKLLPGWRSCRHGHALDYLCHADQQAAGRIPVLECLSRHDRMGRGDRRQPELHRGTHHAGAQQLPELLLFERLPA